MYYLHYMNVNVEGKLPHALEFGPVYGRIVTDDPINGQVFTVIGYGMPRRYYLWSTFSATLRVDEYRGHTVVQGPGWHLCPPMEISEKNVNFFVQGNFEDHLFSQIVDPRIAAWFTKIAKRYQPPGKPAKLRAFLKQMWRDIGNERIEKLVQKTLKTIKD